MFQTYIRGFFGILCVALLLLVLPGFCRADPQDDARANISRANTEIGNLQIAIIGADVGIALNEAALNKAIADKDFGREGALRVLKVGLQAAKDALIKNKQRWEKYKQSWEAVLNRLGG